MPIYDYRCDTCGHKFSKDRPISEIQNLEALGFSSAPRCEKCKSNNVKRVISAPAVIYKDRGFTKYKETVDE